MLDGLTVPSAAGEPQTWEKVVRKLRTGMMPPAGAPRPDRATLDGFAAAVETRARSRRRRRTRTPARRRSIASTAPNTRNAVRDLLDFPIDAAALLPGDDSSEGFDNIASVLSVSPALMQAYVVGGGEDQPPGGRRSDDQRRRSRPTSRRAGCRRPSTARDCRSARAAACSCSTSFRSTPNTSSESAARAAGFRPAGGRRRRGGRDHGRTASASRLLGRDVPRSAAPQDSGRTADDRRRDRPQARTREASTICSPSWRPAPACRASRSTGRSIRPVRATRRAGARSSSAVRRPRRKKTACARTILVDARRRAHSPSGDRARPDDRHADGVLTSRGREAARLRDRHPVRAGARARRSAVHLPVRTRRLRACPPAPSTASAISSWPRACRSSSGAASPTRSCSRWPRPAGSRDPAVLEQQTRRMLADPRARCAGGQPRRAVAAAASARRRLARRPGSSTATSARRSGGKRSCCSRRSFARTAASSI